MRNIVLICLDTVRKDFFDSNATQIASLSDINVDQCRATSAWSTPSHAGMITGKIPHQHQIHTYRRSFADIPESNTFFDNIPDYTRLGVSANTFAGSPFGFNKFFDGFKQMTSSNHRFLDGVDPQSYSGPDIPTMQSYWNFLRDSMSADHTIESLLNGIIGFMRKLNRKTPFVDLLDDGAAPLIDEATDLVQSNDEPYFLYINVMDAHLPLKPHRYLRNHNVPASWSTHAYEQWEYIERRDDFEKYWQYREELYAAVIEYLDRRISKFIRTLQKRSNGPVSFVITSDHGENLGLPEEDGLVNHTSSLSEGLLHVPMSIIDPKEVVPDPSNRLVSHLDLPAMISALAGGDKFEWEMTPRAEVMGMAPNPEPPSRKEFWDRTIRCVYDGTTKYEWDSQGREIVYKLDVGRTNWQQEVSDSFTLSSEIESLFDCDIDTAREEALEKHQSVSVSESINKRLKSLGYL